MKRFKLIALLVAAIMVCQCFAATSVFAANDDELTTAEISAQAIDFLGTVGAITVDKEWDPAGLIGSVTRTYAATVFADIIRGRQTTHYPVVEPVLEDVPAGKGNADNIFLAVAYDVIPEKDGKFDEKGLFTFADLKYAITSLLGYNNYVKATGLGEAELTRLVEKGDIFEGVNYKASQPLTKTEFAIVLKNALHAEMIYQLNYSPESFEFNRDSGITMMQEYLGVIEYQGVITKTPYTSLSGSEGCQEGEVVFGDMRCKIDSTNAADYIGCMVDAYVKVYDDDAKINEILIIDYASSAKVLEIDAEQLIPDATGFRVSNIVYEDANGRTKKASVSGTADYFYNGVACDLSVADLKINSGKLVLVSNSGGSTYNVLKVEAYENYIVDYIDGDDVLHCKLGEDHTLDLNEDRVDFIDIRRTNNRVVKLTQLKSGNVLSVYKSKDGSYVKAILSTNIVEGEIVGVDESGMRTVFTIDNGGSTQDITAYFMGTTWNMDYRFSFPYPEKNFEGAFYLDASGYLAYAEVGAVLVKYGYITGVSKQAGLDETVIIQLVDQDGATREIEIPEKGVRTNDFPGGGMKTKYTREDVYNLITATSPAANYPTGLNRLVKFNVNSKGMLSKIDFAKDDFGSVTESTDKDGNTVYSYTGTVAKSEPEDYYDEEKFTFNSYDEGPRRYLSATMMFSDSQGGASYGLLKDAVVFTLDDADGNISPEDVSVIKGSQVPNDDKFSNVQLFDSNETLGIGAAVISIDSSTVSALSNIAVYDSTYSVINEETEETETKVKYWLNGNLQEGVLSDDYKLLPQDDDGNPTTKLTKGDAIFVYRDYYGEICQIESIKGQLWDTVGGFISGDKLHTGSEGASYNYASSGYLLAASNERIAVDKDATDAYSCKTYLLSGLNVYVVETDGGKTTITPSGVSALAPSLTNSDSSKIIYGGNQARVSTIVVYK